MKLISSFHFAELPFFDSRPTSCTGCGGTKFRMRTVTERLRRPVNEAQVMRLAVEHICRACGWSKWTAAKMSQDQ